MPCRKPPTSSEVSSTSPARLFTPLAASHPPLTTTVAGTPCLQHNGGCDHPARQVRLGGPEASHGTLLAPRAAQRPAWAPVCSHGSGLLSCMLPGVVLRLLQLVQTTSCLSKIPHTQDIYPQHSPVHAHLLAACFCRFPVHVLTMLSRFACTELSCGCCRKLLMQNMIVAQPLVH